MTNPAASTKIVSLHHVQIAMLRGNEDTARKLYVYDPFGNRIELMESAS